MVITLENSVFRHNNPKITHTRDACACLQIESSKYYPTTHVFVRLRNSIIFFFFFFLHLHVRENDF